MEVEVVVRVRGSKNPCLTQVDPAAALLFLWAGVYDGDHEGSGIVSRAG